MQRKQKNAVTEQECQVESAQKEADAAKQALDDAEKKRAQAEADVQKAKKKGMQLSRLIYRKQRSHPSPTAM